MDNEKKLFLKALQEKFDEDPKDEKTKYYCYGGWEQSARKREFNEETNLEVKEGEAILCGLICGVLLKSISLLFFFSLTNNSID